MPLERVFPTLPEGAGRIGLLSSDEFLDRANPFDTELLDGADVARIGVVLCADHASAPQSYGFAVKHFREYGCEVLDVRASCAPDPIPDIDLLYLAGGNARELLTCIQARAGWWDEVLARWRAGMHLAGSSAGAMVLCERALGTCACVDPTHEWGDGLGPLRNVALAVHADRRDPRWLAELPTRAPVPVVALDEGTGVILRPDAAPQVVGEGRVWLLEA
jgi:cyanophycinase-like exopeptidase